MAGTPWTKEEEKILRQLSEAGVSSQTAAKVLRTRSPHSIDSKAKNMGLHMGLGAIKPEIDHEMFKQLVKDAGKKKCI